MEDQQQAEAFLCQADACDWRAGCTNHQVVVTINIYFLLQYAYNIFNYSMLLQLMLFQQFMSITLH